MTDTILDIERLVRQAATTLDAADFNGYARLFAEDGELRTAVPPSALVGRAEIARGMATMSPPAGVHHVTAPRVTVRGARAEGGSAFVAVADRLSADDGLTVFAGMYADEYVRTGGTWLISRRRIELSWGPVDLAPLIGVAGPTIPGGPGESGCHD